MPEGRVYLDIQAERAKQDNKWGVRHDDLHEWRGWMRLITSYTNRAYNEGLVPANQSTKYADGYRLRLVQIAALAVAAIEAYDRVGLVYTSGNQEGESSDGH